MGADYKPGTVAKATVRGVPDVTVMAGYGTSEPKLRWLTTDERLVDELNDGWYFAFDVTDVRPLMVLDFAPSPAHLPQLLRLLRDNFWSDLAGQIEAQIKPPRIPEPGLWGVVESTVTYEGTTYSTSLVRHPGPGTANRWLDQSGSWFSWNELIDPVLIREGVES